MNPIRLAGFTVAQYFRIPWFPMGFIFVLTVILIKFTPYAEHPDVFEQAGQNYEDFVGNWATGLDPLTNDVPWEPIVDPLPIFQWEGVESFSNYLGTVHQWSYQYSTNCIDWEESSRFLNDDAAVKGVLDQLVFDHLPTAYTNLVPAMLLWRAERVE